MKLFHISQNINTCDCFSGAIVCAADEEKARKIHPSWGINYSWGSRQAWESNQWCHALEQVKVKYIGEAIDTTEGIILASWEPGPVE